MPRASLALVDWIRQTDHRDPSRATNVLSGMSSQGAYYVPIQRLLAMRARGDGCIARVRDSRHIGDALQITSACPMHLLMATALDCHDRRTTLFEAPIR